ncbi:MAG TPA: FecR domain-containing protein [Rhizomicrobium sp.]|nr:FecR domain-containing protein [Rhizomicrobium sp.]
MADKGRVLTFPDAAAIETEAAAWVARFDAGDVSARDQAAFQEWLNRSALHRDAIAVYGNLWAEFDTLRTLAESGETERAPVARDRNPTRLEKVRPWLAACAAAAIAVAGGALFFHSKPPQLARVGNHPSAGLSPARYSYETAVGGQKKITLADGSSVILNTNSRLDVDFSGNHRDVHLVRGEAYFEVVHDKARPFTVHANDYVVRDIGTAFDVHLSKAGLVEVGVTKGCVEVKPAAEVRIADAAKSPRVLAAGDDIVLGEKVEHAATVSNVDLGRKLAWRQGQLIYTGQPLSEVLADIGRYSDIKIELADPALENLPVGGAFRTDQIEAIFAALENNFGVHAQWIGPRHVRFTSGREPLPSKD